MEKWIINDLKNGLYSNIERYISDDDRFVRRKACMVISRIYNRDISYRPAIQKALAALFLLPDDTVKSAVIQAFGEIGSIDSGSAELIFWNSLKCDCQTLKYDVVSALKRIGEKSPDAAAKVAKGLSKSGDPRFRRAVVKWAGADG
jgi:HEAT repeat protein